VPFCLSEGALRQPFDTLNADTKAAQGDENPGIDVWRGVALMLAAVLQVVALPTFYQAGHYLHAACGTKSMTKPNTDTKAALPISSSFVL
jgi:hypothetical protein